MNKKVYILHRSAVVQNGLAEILHHNINCEVKLFESFPDFEIVSETLGDKYLVLVEDNQLNSSSFKSFIRNRNGVSVIKIINSFTQSTGNDTIYLYDNAGEIVNKVNVAFEQMTKPEKGEDTLSTREIDVLKLVALGYANKEIADKLHISTHTVISHRKNITEKLGIKSVSGLTVYAVINNFIDTSNINISDLL